MQPIITISNIVINIKISRYQGSLIVLDRKASRWVHPDCVCIAYVESKEVCLRCEGPICDLETAIKSTCGKRSGYIHETCKRGYSATITAASAATVAVVSVASITDVKIDNVMTDTKTDAVSTEISAEISAVVLPTSKRRRT